MQLSNIMIVYIFVCITASKFQSNFETFHVFRKNIGLHQISVNYCQPNWSIW